MDPTSQNQASAPSPTENQIVPGPGLTPEQQILIRQNLERSRKRVEEKKVEQERPPEYYTYIFTKTYIFISTGLIILAFAVFGLIIYLQLTRMPPA